MKTKVLFILLSIISLAGFSQEELFYNLYYYLNPKHSITTYNKILLVTNASLETRKHMRHAAKKAKYNVVLYDDLFPPYKQWSDEVVNSTINEVGIDAILFINITNLNTYQSSSGSTTFFPATSFTPPMSFSNSSTSAKVGSTELEIYLVDDKIGKDKDEYVIYITGSVNGKPLDAAYKSLYKLLKNFPKIGVARPPNF